MKNEKLRSSENKYKTTAHGLFGQKLATQKRHKTRQGSNAINFRLGINSGLDEKLCLLKIQLSALNNGIVFNFMEIRITLIS